VPGEKGLGDCIDCNICVQVCPTGIDIREGLQYECIACAACVDACDSVMEKMDYPKGLIKFTTQNELDGKPSRILRPRIIVYSTLLAALFVVFIVTLLGREPLHLDVIRDRNALYRELPGDRVENVYMLKILNKSEVGHVMQFTVDGLPGIEIDTDPAELHLEGGEVRTVAARIRADRTDLAPGGHDVIVNARARDDKSLQAIGKARFMAPPRR
jgi:cytochrome c oxidase accessory protein FixG